MTESEGYIECVLPPGFPSESLKESPQPATHKLTLRNGGDATHISHCAVHIHSGNDWVVQLAALTQKVQEATTTLSEILSLPRSAENDLAVRRQQEVLSSLKYDLQRHILAGGTELPPNLMEQLLGALKPGVPNRQKQADSPMDFTSATAPRSTSPVPPPHVEEESVYSNMATVQPHTHTTPEHDTESVYENFANQSHCNNTPTPGEFANPNLKKPPPVPARTYNTTYANRPPSTSSSSLGGLTQPPMTIYEQNRPVGWGAGLGYDTLHPFSNPENANTKSQISSESPYDVFSGSASPSGHVAAAQAPQNSAQKTPLQVEEEEDDGEHIYESLDMVKKPTTNPPGRPIPPPLFDRGSLRMQRKMRLSISSSPPSTDYANIHDATAALNPPVPPPRTPTPTPTLTTTPTHGANANVNTHTTDRPFSPPSSSRTPLHSRSNSLTRPLPVPTPTGTPTVTPHSSTMQLMQPLAESYQSGGAGSAGNAGIRVTPPSTPASSHPSRSNSITSLGGYAQRPQPPTPQAAQGLSVDGVYRPSTMPRSRSETTMPLGTNWGGERPRAMSVGCDVSRSPVVGVRNGRSNSEAAVTGLRGMSPAPSLPTLGDEHEVDIYDNLNNFRNLSLEIPSRSHSLGQGSQGSQGREGKMQGPQCTFDADGYVDTSKLDGMAMGGGGMGTSGEGVNGSTGTLDSVDSMFGTSVRMRRKMSSLSKKGSLVRK
eukprot:comp54208_c0_seq1/m.47743 comp54208_c0_seq1/g.47743  ORF comp54208_c0_seq1/g.47743 comp54208_c0_seq1/m.47743 type:complete len:714 (-) comp54208_c0_seq1:2-2143(-)